MLPHFALLYVKSARSMLKAASKLMRHALQSLWAHGSVVNACAVIHRFCFTESFTASIAKNGTPHQHLEQHCALDGVE